MPEFTEVYANQVVLLLFENQGISKETINEVFEIFGRELINHDNKKRNKEEIRIMHSINTTISELGWLIGIITDIQTNPNNKPGKKQVLLVDIDNIKALLKASLKTADFLIKNYEILSKEFKEKYPPKALSKTRSAINIRLEEAYQNLTGFYPKPFKNIRHFNLHAYEGLTGSEAAKRYIDWINTISRVIMYHIHMFDKKHDIKTNWMN